MIHAKSHTYHQRRNEVREQKGNEYKCSEQRTDGPRLDRTNAIEVSALSHRKLTKLYMDKE